VPREPELVRGLQVVARRRLTVARTPFRQEALVRIAERRPGRDGAGAEVEG
jgi:hypothetical protein